MKISLRILLIISAALSVTAQKEIYIPQSITSKMDLNNSSSQWCHTRSRESENVAVYWESGFGSDPSAASGDYRTDIDKLLEDAERAYTFYRDTLQFAIEGSSWTDKYKLLIFLLYTTDWTANGSGEDDKVQSLRVNPWAASIDNVVAHEIGHCFQYITSCDGEGGYRYGLGENGAGGNGFWEQCANWMSFKVYPEKQFTENDFNNYIKSNHLHILHETPRYANYFIQDYWTWKHDVTYTGKLWRESRFPEDPVETCKRLDGITQEEFNDDMYEHAARLTTWDLPAIKSYGENYIDRRAQVKMNLAENDYWLVDKSVCIENYGYNSIKLNPPSDADKVKVRFRGKAGESGYRAKNIDKGGWRYGFVALLKDGTRVYSDMGTAKMENGDNPEDSLSFSCPDNCEKLWLVVSGAPQEHWKHEWDDNDANDEQWPYEVQFSHTNLMGEKTEIRSLLANRTGYGITLVKRSGRISLPRRREWSVTGLTGRKVMSGYGTSVDFRSFAPGGYVLHYDGKAERFLKTPSLN